MEDRRNPAPPEHEISCGAVTFTVIDGEPHYVIIRSLNGTYGFPKGHMEQGETSRQTALREIYEETHLRVKLLHGFRRVDSYALPGKANALKTVVYFCATYDAQEIIYPRDELKGAELLDYESALRRLTFGGSKRILRQADAFIRDYLKKQ